MSFDYGEMADLAKELLAEFGASCQLKTSAAGAYDPSTGSTAVTLTPQTINAAVFDFPVHLVNGTTILQGDRQAFYSGAAGSAQPKPGDILSWMGQDFIVITAKPLAPAGVQVLMELQIRK